VTSLLPEQTIRYTTGPLGLVGSDGEVAEGDLGRVLGPAPDDGWWLTEPAKYPGKICPVSRGMVEAT
jgi:hypothetical protein